ncbi:MAG: MotA/TolQ/ExbB proton channel family protein [Deltaproteobacteria bacterium]|nr:MotA/TolQ/ExbB proton channel family protein [Deltaproteobacteria bacterium]
MQFSIVELWQHMGPFARGIVLLLLVMSFASMVIVVDRLLVFRRAHRRSRTFAERMATAVASADWDPLSGASGEDTGYLGRVIAAGWKALRCDSLSPSVASELVARALERRMSREMEELKRGLGVLATIASTAPFVGLLGTVMGIVNAFRQMAATGSGGLGTVSAGIAEALGTTALGLVVAIPALGAFNFLQGWVDSRAVDVAESSNEFLDWVVRRLETTQAERASTRAQ